MHRLYEQSLRYLRVRVGEAPFVEESGRGIQIMGRSGENVSKIILDHISVSWAADENLTVWSQGSHIKNVTLSGSISSEGFGSKGAIVGSHVDDARNNMTGIDFHHNFFAHNDARNPYVGVKEQSIVNNIVYNWGTEGGIMARGGLAVDIVGNLTKPGPSSDRSSNPDDIQWFPYASDTCEWSTYCISGNPSIYLRGNAGYVNGVLSNQPFDNWRMIEGWSSTQGEFPGPNLLPTCDITACPREISSQGG